MTTDERIARLEKRLTKVYSQAAKELADKANSYFERFKRMDEQKRKLVEEGKLTEKEYKIWRQNRIMEGKRWTEVQTQMAQTMTNANKVAAAYINRELPPLYAQNFNEVGEDAERIIRGYSFDLTNANTVKKLSTQNRTLLPYKVVDGRRDVRWNTQRVNASVLQSILQGESIPQMAKRLATNLPGMNMESAVRNARTACTGAECKGRLDGMKQLEDDGVILKKEWIATTDARTREAHLELDGVQVDIDEPFVNSIGRIMYPGDPNADPANTYNCRCSIGTRIVGFSNTKKESEMQLDSGIEAKQLSKNEYDEWQASNSTAHELERNFSEKYGVEMQDGIIGEDKYIDGKGWVSDLWAEVTDDLYQVQNGYGHCGYIQSSDGSKAINAYLRRGEVGRLYRKQEMEKTIESMRRLINETSLNEALSVDRCAGIDAIERMGIEIGEHGRSFRIGHCFCTEGVDFESIAKKINSEYIGTEIVDKGFMSASVVPEKNIFGGSDVTFTIIAPKGTHAFISENTIESEIVFMDGTRQEITGARVTERAAKDHDGKETTRKTLEILLKIIN